MSSLRSVLNSSKNSLLRIIPGTSPSKRSDSGSVTDLVTVDSCQLQQKDETRHDRAEMLNSKSKKTPTLTSE